jgi:hypothetical protein
LCDFAHDEANAGGDTGLTGHTCGGVVCDNGVKDGVGDLVADLVGMTFGDAFGCEKESAIFIIPPRKHKKYSRSGA